MPTGYTGDLKPDTTFTEFALRCARGMGALIMMRDDPLDAPIPDEFKPGDYYRTSMEDAASKQQAMAEMTVEQAAVEMEKENAEIARIRQKSIDYSRRLKKTYERMIGLVEAWVPPTSEHFNFKKFMLEQLRESLKFDCHDEDAAAKWYAGFCGTPAQWLAAKRENAAKDAERSQKSFQEENDRTAQRNSWVRELRRSLTATPPSE